MECAGAETRDKIIMRASWAGVAVNTLLAAVKVAVGLLSSSIAIVSEGINNATDSLSAVLTMVGTALARKKPTAAHPFGFGRVEYLTSMVVSAVIILTAGQFLISSVKLIFAPEPLDISYTTLAVIAVSAAVKLFLGEYTVRAGKKASSEALVGVGVDCRWDSLISVVTIVSSVVFLVTGRNIDAYAGVVMSLFVLKSGLGLLWGTIGTIIGKASDKELADRIYREVLATPGVINAADMMLHDYGPEAYSGSVNIEVDHAENIGDIYERVHELQLRILREHKVTMVFGIYAVDHDHAEMAGLRDLVGAFVAGREHVKSFHALYLSPGEPRKFYCDLVVAFELKDRASLRREFLELLARTHPEYEVELVIETEYV